MFISNKDLLIIIRNMFIIVVEVYKFYYDNVFMNKYHSYVGLVLMKELL